MKLELDHDLDNIETKDEKLNYLKRYKLKDNGDKIIEEYEDATYNPEANDDDYEDPDPGSSSGSDSESDKDLDEAEEGRIKEIRPKWKRKSDKEKEKQRKENAKKEKERKAKEREERKAKEREEKERKEKEKRDRQKDEDEESSSESEIEDNIIIEDSEDDDEEKFEEDEEQNLENEYIQDPLQFLLPTVEETDWEELIPLLQQMQNTLELFERKHRTVRDNRFIGENIKVMKQYIDYMELDDVNKLTRSQYDEYFNKFTSLIKQAADMYVDVNNRKIKTTVKAITNKEMQKFLMQEFPEQINMDISALESDDHEILKTDNIIEIYCEPDERNFFQKIFHPIKRAFGGKALAMDAQTRLYLLYETRHNIAWRIANLNAYPEWRVRKDDLQEMFAYTTRQIQFIKKANNLVREYASLDLAGLSHNLADIEDDIANRRMGPIRLKSTYDQIVGTMYGFFMNMYEKFPASLSNTEREYQLKANEIFKYEISILNSLKLKLEKIMPNELLIISRNALATPPSEHGRYIPDITNEELIRSLSLNNPSFVDLNTLVSPNDNPTIPNMIDAKPPPGFYDSIGSPFNYNFETRHDKYTPLKPLIPNLRIDNDYELVDIYGEEGENLYTNSFNAYAGETLVDDLLQVNAMKAKCYNDWFKYAENCNLPKLMTLIKNSNATITKCELRIEKLLKTRPLTYTQKHLLKQKEDEIELEEVKKTAFGNASETTTETPLSLEKKKKDELELLTQSVEDLINILSPLAKNLNDLYKIVKPTAAEKTTTKKLNQQFQALKIQIEAQMYKVYRKRIEISESQLTYAILNSTKIKKEWKDRIPTMVREHLHLLSEKLALEEVFDETVNNFHSVYNVSALFLESNLEKAQVELNKLIEEQDDKIYKLQKQIKGIINDDILKENLKIEKFRLEYISNKLKIQLTQEYIQKYNLFIEYLSSEELEKLTSYETILEDLYNKQLQLIVTQNVYDPYTNDEKKDLEDIKSIIKGLKVAEKQIISDADTKLANLSETDKKSNERLLLIQETVTDKSISLYDNIRKNAIQKGVDCDQTKATNAEGGEQWLFAANRKKLFDIIVNMMEEKIALAVTGLELGRLQIKEKLNETEEEQEQFLKSKTEQHQIQIDMYLSSLDQESDFQKLQSVSATSGNKMVVKASESRLKMIPEKNIRRYSGEYIPKAVEVKHKDFLSQVKYFVNNMKKINEMLSYEDIVEAFPVPQEYPPQPPIKTYTDTNVINVMMIEFKSPTELAAPIPEHINISVTQTPIHTIPTSSTKDILTELPIAQLGDLLLDNVVLQPQPLFKLEEEVPYEMHHGEKIFQNERPLPLHQTPHKRNDNSDEVPVPFGNSSDINDRLNRVLVNKKSKIQFQNMKAVLEEKMKPKREPSKLSQFEYHLSNEEEVNSPVQLSFQKYPSIPILNDQNQIQVILQQQVVDKIENTNNPLDTLDSMLSEKKLEVQELILAVNKGEEVKEQLQEALQEEKAISEVIDVIEEKLEIKQQEETPPLLTKDEVIKIKEDTQNSMLSRLETTDNNPMIELQNMISEMEEKVNDVNMNIDYTPTSIKEVEILKIQLDAAEEISEIIDNQNVTFITPTTTTIPFFFQRHVPDEFKPLTADEVTILQMKTQERIERKTEQERQSRLVEINKISKYISNSLVDAVNEEQQQKLLIERAKLNVEIQTFRDSFNLEAYEKKGEWKIRNVYTALDTTQRNSILEETANTYAEEPTPVKQKMLNQLAEQNELIEKQMKETDEEDKLGLQQKLESNKIIMNTLTYLIGVNTPVEMDQNTTQPFNRINDNVLNTPIIQTLSPEISVDEFDTVIPSSPEIEIPSHAELEEAAYINYVNDFRELTDSDRNDMLQTLINDNEYLKDKPDESTDDLFSKKESIDIAIKVLVEEYHAQIQPKLHLSDDQIESIRKLTHSEYANATNEERMQLMNKLINENGEYTKLQTDEAKKSIYTNNVIMDYLLNELHTNMFAVDENINLKKEDSILEKGNVFDEDSIRDSPILEFKSFTKNEVENVKREVENEYMSKQYMTVLDEILKFRDLNDKLLIRLDDGDRQVNLKDWKLNEIIIQTLQEILDEKSKDVIPDEMFPSFNTVQESPTNLKEEITDAVAEELSEVDDPINKLEDVKEDLVKEIEQLVVEAEHTTDKFEQKEIEEKLETVVTKVEVVNTLLKEYNEEVDSPSPPPLNLSPKPSTSEPVFKNVFESQTMYSSPEIEQEVKDRLDDTNIVITNKNKAITEVKKLANDIEESVTLIEKVSKQPNITPEVKEALKETAKEAVIKRNLLSELIKQHDIKSEEIKLNAKKKREKEKKKSESKPSTSIFENVSILKERSPSPSSYESSSRSSSVSSSSSAASSSSISIKSKSPIFKRSVSSSPARSTSTSNTEDNNSVKPLNNSQNFTLSENMSWITGALGPQRSRYNTRSRILPSNVGSIYDPGPTGGEFRFRGKSNVEKVKGDDLGNIVKIMFANMAPPQVRGVLNKLKQLVASKKMEVEEFKKLFKVLITPSGKRNHRIHRN